MSSGDAGGPLLPDNEPGILPARAPGCRVEPFGRSRQYGGSHANRHGGPHACRSDGVVSLSRAAIASGPADSRRCENGQWLVSATTK